MATPSRSKGRAIRRSLATRPIRGRRVRAEAVDSASELLDPGYGHEPHPGEATNYDHDFPYHEGTEKPKASPTVPKSLVKFIIALFLLPVAWVLTETFLQAFTTSVHHGLLATQTFGCFAAGAVLFGILYLVVPRNALMIPYVLGHEVTHAIWAWIFGGKVADHFHVSQEGGHVLTDRVNTWIILAPYFFPIYCILVVTIYGAASLVTDLSGFRWLLFLLIGVTLAFHLVFTFLLIMKGQPDLRYGGTFFSLIVIYLINLFLITGLLLLTGRTVSPVIFGQLLVENSDNFLATCHAVITWVIGWLSDLYVELSAK